MWFPRSEPLCLFQMYLKMCSCWGKSNSKHQNNFLHDGAARVVWLITSFNQHETLMAVFWRFCDLWHHSATEKEDSTRNESLGLNKKHTNLVITNFNAPCWKVQPCEQLKHLHMPDHQMKGSDPKMRKQDCIFSGHSDTFVLNNLFRITQRESIYVPSN